MCVCAHIYSGACPGDLAFFRPTRTKIGLRLCVCVCVFVFVFVHTQKHKNTNDPSLPVDLEVFDPARGLVPSRHPSFWASGRPTRGLVGFVFVWSEIFQEGRFDHAFRCALESHVTTMPPVCSIRVCMRWARSCGRVRSRRSPRQSPVPPGQLRPAISVFRFLLANGCEVRPSRWCPMCTAAWPIQRARPRPRPCPLWPFDPSRRLKITFRFWQQIRSHARTIAPTHKRTLTRASTPSATRANVLANASRKHTHAQTPRRRKSPTRTNATRTAHAPTNARTDANDTPRGRDKCPRTRVHAYQHATRSNTPTQHLKV